MRNKHAGKAAFFLKPDQKIDNLCLYGYIQCGYRLITKQEFRVYCQGSGNSNPLPLTPGKFMYITDGMFYI